MEAIRTQESEASQMYGDSCSSLKRCPKASSVTAEVFSECEEGLSDLILMSSEGGLKKNSLCGSIVNISEGNVETA